MTTSTAEANNYTCPVCHDELTEDPSDKGFVRHKNNPDCDFERGERGERDIVVSQAAGERTPPEENPA